MTPSEEVRKLLDELGVEHYDHENGEPLRDLSEAGTDTATSWRMGGANVCAVPNKYGTFDLWIDNCTPAQAIAATADNADLRELVQEMYAIIRSNNSWWDWECKDSKCFAKRMRELGMEVDE